MRTFLTTLLCVLPLLSLSSREQSTAPLVLVEEVRSELESGRISPEDAELLTEWIENVEAESLRDWIENRTDLASEFVAFLNAWLEQNNSKKNAVDSVELTPATFSIQSRMAFRIRDGGNSFREFLSVQGTLDRTTRVSIDFNHADDDSVQIRRRSIRIRPSAGLFHEITLGSFTTKIGSGLLFAASRSAISPTGTFPDGFLFPSGREMNGILLKSELGGMAMQMIGSIKKRDDTSHTILAIELSQPPTTRLRVGFVAGISWRMASGSASLGIPISMTLARMHPNHGFALEVGGLVDETFVRPGLNSRFNWVTGSDHRLQHRLKYWWYDPHWREISGNGTYMSLSTPEHDSISMSSAQLRAGQYGFRYDVSRESQGGAQKVLPRLAVVFGRRAADTFGVMLEPSIRLPLKTANPLATTLLELVGQVRTRKPARSAALFLDEAEAVAAEIQFKKNRTEVSHKIGIESLNDQLSLMSQLMARVRYREWSIAGRGLIRNISKDQRSSWIITTEIRRVFQDRSLFLRSLVENAMNANRDRRKVFVLEAGLAWTW